MNAIEKIDEVMRDEASDGTVGMKLPEAGKILDQFQTTKDPALGVHKWHVVEAFLKAAPYMPENGRALLYNACMQFCWQTMDDYRQTQYDIRLRLINPMFALLDRRRLPRRQHEPQRIAVLSAQTQDRGPYANTRNLYSYLRGRSERFEWSWYNYGPHDEMLLQEMNDGGIAIRSFDGQPSRVIDGIADCLETDGIDVVISDMYWYVPLALYARRPVPLWLHWSPGFQKMPADAVLLPDTQEPFDERCEVIPYVLDARYLKRDATPEPRRGPLVFGTMARHAKVSPEFLETVGKILDRHPNAVYVLAGGGNLEPWHPRVQVIGVRDVHAVLPNVDVFLDTFPLCGCMAVMEAQAHNVPVVTLSQPATASYDRFKGGVTHSLDGYHALVDSLVRGELRGEVMAKAQAGMAALTNVQAGAEAMEQAVLRRWR